MGNKLAAATAVPNDACMCSRFTAARISSHRVTLILNLSQRPMLLAWHERPDVRQN